MANLVTPDERERIVVLLKEHGGNRNQVAKLASRSPSTIQKIAEEEGIAPNIRAPKKANWARMDYALANRLDLGNLLFDKVRDMAKGAKTAGELKDLATTFGILQDKRRIDDGQAADRSERRSGPLDLSGMTEEELERFARSLDADSP